ncbi:MAG: ABC transporter permease, partial [Dehalococcoidia bacterium]
AQRLLNREGEIKHIIVSNKGGALSGVERTDDVIDSLQPTLTPLGLEADPTKKDAVDFADELGSVFTSFFVTFGTFSIIAGMLLIFLIFVMLAAQRKPNMGIARAVGTQRRHLIQMFVFEGAVYDLMAAAVGALLGLAVAFGMVLIMAKAFATFGVEIKHDFRLRSLVVAYTLGMLLTFVVVTLSAWRVSLLNIVTAIRDLPDPVLRRGGRLTLVLGALGLLLGFILTIAGLGSEQATPFFLGISFVIIGLVPLLRRLGLPDRAAYTLPGIALLVWWLLPFDALDFILPDLSSDFSIFIISGVMLVIASTWTVMYNSDLIIHAVMAVVGRIRALAPVLKTAISYPLTNRFRTGMTLAMFSLVVFTLVVMATLTNAFSDVLSQEDAFSGGFDVRATTVSINPVDDMAAAIPDADSLNADDFAVVANQSLLSLEAKQADADDRDFEDYPVRGLDDQFLANNTYEFALIAQGYGSPPDVWQALADNPNLAIVDPIPVPRRDNFDFQAGVPDFRLEGFFLEDETFSPIEVQVRDPQTGKATTLTIIGVLKETFPFFMLGIGTSQRTLTSAFGEQAQPTIHFFRLRDGVDAAATTDALETAFLRNGMEADVLAEELEEAVGTQLTFNYILQGFMGLGLVVGVAALGVISARSVVERRQQIGVLRAIGFQRPMVQLSFLLESSFVAILGIALGFILGLALSFNLIVDISQQASFENIQFAVPWLNLAIIFLITYLASLVMTFAPALQASRVYPAAALRYE